jgi:hypothetical protein
MFLRWRKGSLGGGGGETRDLRFPQRWRSKVVVFWDVTPCSDVVGYRHFGGPCCLAEDGSSKIVRSDCTLTYEGVSKTFRTGRLERELQMVQLSATRCSCNAILWVSLVSFAAITLCVASQQVFVAVYVYFVIDSVRKLLDTASYILFYGVTSRKTACITESVRQGAWPTNSQYPEVFEWRSTNGMYMKTNSEWKEHRRYRFKPSLHQPVLFLFVLPL